MNDSQREAHIAALTRELRACEIQGKTDRVEAINKELRRLTGKASAPVKRAEKRG